MRARPRKDPTIAFFQEFFGRLLTGLQCRSLLGLLSPGSGTFSHPLTSEGAAVQKRPLDRDCRRTLLTDGPSNERLLHLCLDFFAEPLIHFFIHR